MSLAPVQIYNAPMIPKLTSEMREALLQRPGQPVTVEDDQTHMSYVLLPWAVYQKLRFVSADESFDVSGTYAAQSVAAGAAGWDDPEMDIYDEYDSNWQAP